MSVSAKPKADGEKITPSMQQYFDVKEQHPSALLFFRMGDFYELFFDDAVQAAAALDIALTKRGKHRGEDIAMCGVPAHSAEGYLAQLTRKGFTVAICDQMETPAEAKKRGSKSVVRDGLSAELARIAPSEILVPDAIFENGDLLHVLEEVAQFTPLGAASFDSTSATLPSRRRARCRIYRRRSVNSPEPQCGSTPPLAAILSLALHLWANGKARCWRLSTEP